MIITAEHLAIFRAAGACAEGLADAERVREYGRLRLGYRVWVAGHPSTSADVLAHLAGDAYYVVRWAVADHPSTPAKVLAHLATDANHNVRWSVADHPSTTAEVLARMATDANHNVRHAVAVRGVS